MNKKIFLALVIGVIMTTPLGATGTPDYGASLSSNPTIQSYEAGEDTTRLLMGGGANSRSGRWLWATGFEGEVIGGGSVNLSQQVLNGSVSIVGLTKTTGTNPSNMWQGNKALQLTTGPNNNDYAAVLKYIPWQFGLAGIEFMFSSLVVAQTNMELKIEMLRFLPGVIARWGAIVFVWDGAGNVNLYTDNNGTRTLVQNVNSYFSGNPNAQWHYFKFVYDAQNNLYARVYFDNLSFAIGIPAFTGGSGSQNYGDRYSIWLATKTGAAKSVWIDNLVITGDEP